MQRLPTITVVLVLAFIAFGCSRADAVQEEPALVAEADRALPGPRTTPAQSFRITSSILHEQRRVRIVLPESFSKSAPTRRYPVSIVLDGETNVPQITAVSDELSSHGLIPECILVAIENTDRLRDLTPPGLSVSGSSLKEGGDRFLDFVERELLPAVDRQFRGAPPRILVGHSSGGILATYVAATRSTYRAVIAIDTPIHLDQDWLARKLTARAKEAPTPLRYVSYEARFGWSDAAWDALVAASPANWRLHREHLAQEGHETMFLLAAYLGLRDVFSDYSRLSAPESPTSRILPYYATVSASLGASLVPPQRVVRDVLDDAVMEGNGAIAREAYDLLVSGYGAPADGSELTARITDLEQLPPPAETVEGLLATPFPTADELRPYLGDWVGDQWMKPEQPRTHRLTLRFRVEAGKAIGELLDPEAPPDSRLRRVDYLRVTPTGLTYGIMNGMRPRGVVLYEGTLSGGDTLSGKSRFGGIRFEYPPEARVDPGFAFRRVVK